MTKLYDIKPTPEEIAQLDANELAFTAFWAWTGFPTEDVCRQAWLRADPYSKRLWARVADAVGTASNGGTYHGPA